MLCRYNEFITLQSINDISQKLVYQSLPRASLTRLYFFLMGQFISVVGTWMQSTALPYLAYRISGRPLDLGLIGFASTLPTLLFALPAGVLVERWDKRKATIILQTLMSVQAFGLAYLTFTNQLQIWHIVSLAFFYGTAVAIEVTARQAMLVELAGKEALPSAIALQTTAFNLGRIIGPLCAAGIITWTGGEGSVFLANGISFVFVVLGLYLAKTKYKVEKEVETTRSMGSEFREGLEYIRNTPIVLSTILMSALLGFLGIPLLQQIPALARDVLVTAFDTEVLIATRTSNLYLAQGVGALTAAFMMAYFNLANKEKTLVWGQALFMIPVTLLGLVTNVHLAYILLALIGWGTVTQLITMNTMIQIRVPNELRGRVFSIYFWGLQGVAPFGSIVVGWVAQTWNVPTSLVAGGLISFISALVVKMLFRKKK
ncbi:MAG: major facilitator superfamily protein [Chloroflexi bacterium OLB14]|nr:MAG: major facilitator superfamily protein [Chloroflexi bacterium OLB14]